MKKYCKKLREWVMKIVNYELMSQKEYHEEQNKCFLCDKRFCYDKKK